jgi:predicted transcriptional regulator YdeE
MDVAVITKPAMKVIALKTLRNGRDVRSAWKEGQEIIKERNFEWINREIGYVLVPEWQWSTSVEDLWVGVEVEDFISEHEGFDQFKLPERKYAAIKVAGDRGQMEKTYRYLDKWFKENGYERDYSQGVYSIEANKLKPINPFDIPADEINYFDFEIYAPIR